MSDQVVYLKTPQHTPSVVTPITPSVIVGRQYQVNNDGLDETLHGICGGQDYTRHYGRMLSAMDNLCFVWDVDGELTSEEPVLCSAEGEAFTLTPTTKILTSHFVFSHSALCEPKIIHPETGPQLTTTANFDFVFNTTLQAVHLGLLSLVETQCFAQLKNGERFTLRESGEGNPVLYLTDSIGPHDVITSILEINGSADSLQHSHRITLTQPIPDQLEGSEVETLTVLEQYTTFFMQRELPFSQENIWTPLCPPVTWGWSMRVAKRHDGDWCIVRQKLLTPTVGHNGLEMPVWEGNQLDQ